MTTICFRGRCSNSDSTSAIATAKPCKHCNQDDPIYRWRRRKQNLLRFGLLLASCVVVAESNPDTDATAATMDDDHKSNYLRSNVQSNSWMYPWSKPFLPNDDDDDDGDDALANSDSFNNDSIQRELSSNSQSNSRDGDDGDDNVDDYTPLIDDDYRVNRDDDFYKYVGDPQPPKLLPLTGRDVIGFMLASLGATLGSSGGIGGGGIVVPVYIMALGLPPRIAIPLGSVTVFGGSLAGLLLNLRRRHPLADRPIIDWDLILVMEPVCLVGALLGAILHRVIQEKILVVLLVLLLSVTAHTTLSKAKRMYDAEVRYIEHLKAARDDYISRMCSFRSAFRASASGWSAQAIGDRKSETLSPGRTIISPGRTHSLESKTVSPNTSKLDADERQRILILNPDFVTLRSDLLEQEKVTPRSKILALMGKFSVLIFLNLTLGGGAFDSPWGIQCGSVAYWVVHVIMVAFLIASAWAAQTYLVNRHEIKEIVRFDYVHGDIRWEPRNAVIYPALFIFAGFCAGMFGIGGGMITVPIMLAMGVHPAVVTATASTMVFFTAALSASSFAVFDLILWDYAVVCVLLGFIGSLFGQGIMTRARKAGAGGANFERNSFIAYCIGCVIMLSAILITLQYVLHIANYDEKSSATKSASGGLCEGFRI